jgi:methionyl-tRNA formyltransferase
MVVVAYGLILPRVVLDIPRFGCINVHASLLPRWRGAAPIQRAIQAGDRETGITIMQMDEGLDTGPLLKQQACAIKPDETAASLHDKLANLGVQCLLEVLQDIERRCIQPVPQDEYQATYAEKLSKLEACLDWRMPASVNERCIRAFNPAPVAYSFLNGQRIRIWKASVLAEDSTAGPGTIVAVKPQGIDIACGEGVLRLQEIQLPGKKALAVAEVLNAQHQLFSVGDTLVGQV